MSASGRPGPPVILRSSRPGHATKDLPAGEHSP
jgi:hypothetical protein